MKSCIEILFFNFNRLFARSNENFNIFLKNLTWISDNLIDHFDRMYNKHPCIEKGVSGMFEPTIRYVFSDCHRYSILFLSNSYSILIRFIGLMEV